MHTGYGRITQSMGALYDAFVHWKFEDAKYRQTVNTLLMNNGPQLGPGKSESKMQVRAL